MPRQSSKYLPVAGVAATGGLFAASPALAGVDVASASGELVRFGGSIPAGARAHVEAVYDSYANPANEVWLDLTTDARGYALVAARQAWQFPPGAGARSVIIHEEHTGVTPPDAGPAGARLGCLDVVF